MHPKLVKFYLFKNFGWTEKILEETKAKTAKEMLAIEGLLQTKPVKVNK